MLAEVLSCFSLASRVEGNISLGIYVNCIDIFVYGGTVMTLPGAKPGDQISGSVW